MPIRYSRKDKTFTLTTKSTRYVFGIAQNKYLVHHFYGKKSEKYELYKPYVVSFSPYLKENGNTWSPDVFPQEFSFFGSGDFRCSSLKLRGKDGGCVTDFTYAGHRIGYGGVTPDVPVPCPRTNAADARADGKGVQTLTVLLRDKVTGCLLTLCYNVFYEEDVITRGFCLDNKGKDPVKIEKCMSLCLDLPSCDYDMISLYGGHYDERHYQRVPLHHGMQSVYSRRGASSPQYNPFIALCGKKATEEKGEVYGFNFIWSGSFLDEVEVDQTDCTRVQIGLGEENFGYTVEPGGSFASPQALTT